MSENPIKRKYNSILMNEENIPLKVLKQTNEGNEIKEKQTNTKGKSRSIPLKELHCPYDCCGFVVLYPHELVNHLEEHISRIESKHPIESSNESVIQIVHPIMTNNKNNEENNHSKTQIHGNNNNDIILPLEAPPKPLFSKEKENNGYEYKKNEIEDDNNSLYECDDNNGVYECKNCGYITKRKDHLYRHSNKHISNEEKPYKCKNCEFGTTNGSYIKNHVEKHNEDNHILNCPHCDMKLSKLIELSNHLNENHEMFNEYYSSLNDGIELKCNYYECEEISNSNEDYVIHLSSHFDENEKMKCIYKECSFISNNEEILIKHIENDHNNEISINCPENDCNYHIMSKKLMLEHLKEFHYNENDRNHCSVENCDFISNNINILVKHRLLNHMDYKIYLCKNCDYKAKNPSTLKTHLQSHMNKSNNNNVNNNNNTKEKKNKVYKCEIPNCIYKGTRKYNLILHYKTHAKYLQLYESNKIQPNSSYLPVPLPFVEFNNSTVNTSK